MNELIRKLIIKYPHVEARANETEGAVFEGDW